jgi:uracil-DNA glycosylase family 4
MALVKPQTCRTCIGYPWSNCRGYSRVTGSGKIPLLLLGEASGAAEERKGDPFIGQAGEVLDKAIKLAGLTRDDYSVTNVLRCRPPDNKLLGMPYERAALDHCRQYLDAVVAERQPTIILALGEIPLREVSAVAGSQSSLRGYCLPSKYPGVSVIGTFHPSRILRGDWHLLGVLIHDLKRANQYATRGIPTRVPVNYCLSPTKADLLDYLARLDSDRSLVVAYDLETKAILKLTPPDEIIQIQFSSGVGEAIVVPFSERWFIDAVFATENDKWDYNGRLFDRPLLRANGVKLHGQFYDLIDLYSFLQSGFVSGKDDTGGDKRIPSKLMSLQSCLSFYDPAFGPWKSVKFPEWNDRWMGQKFSLPLRLYGGKDVDATVRCGLRLFKSLDSLGVREGYQHRQRFSDVLDLLHENGLPVDAAGQAEAKRLIDESAVELTTQLQLTVPKEILPTKCYKGWPVDAREAVKAAGLWVKNCKPWEFPQVVEAMGYSFSDTTTIKYLEFNPNSSQQILSYLEYKGYPIPLHIDTKKPTTGQKELESLVLETDDAVLKLIQKAKKLTKLGGTYCGGEWIPGADGRVHGEFRFGTASGQTSCTRPNQQQFPQHFDPEDKWLEPIAEQIKSCIRAEPGHVFVKIDAKGAHSRMQAWLAEDPDYYRLSNLGTHAFNTAFHVEVPDRWELLAMDDVSLLRRLKEIKKQYDYEYNFVKRVSFNMQYLGGAEKAAHTLRVSVMEVEALMNMVKGLFPKSFKDFPESVRRQLQKSPLLISAGNHPRWIWNEDVQQGVAFMVANPFHVHWQKGLVRLFDKGILQRFPITNFCHDDVWLHVRESDVDDCVAACRKELEQPSETMVNSLGAFQVNTEVQVGRSMNTLKDYVVSTC